MTTLDAGERPIRRPQAALFALTVFFSASLVFTVQPMAAKLLLPLLGGGPSIWNTSLAFFQIALLAGYAYAHLLQRVRSVRAQASLHCAVLLLAALTLPLQVHSLFGEPSSNHPALWLLGVLTVSLGAPFAALSATAPLVQAWHARVIGEGEGGEPYVLYAASNLGSLLALLSYPILIEPLATLRNQTTGWSLGYGGFVLVMAGLALSVARTQIKSAAMAELTSAPNTRPTFRERLTWIALAAIPSSLMMGVTTHLTTDVASAPFLWVAPLALYLLTFVIAFQRRPAISQHLTFTLQAVAVAACATILPFRVTNFPVQLLVHLSAFFFTALMCHQALVARRPPPAHLTAFYLAMSVGGVIGGAFNAFLAPVIFNNVFEYPLVLALACLVRPPYDGQIKIWRWTVFGLGFVLAIAAAIWGAPIWRAPHHAFDAKIMFAIATIATILVRDVKTMFAGLVVLLLVTASVAGDRVDITNSWRSFFGIVRESRLEIRPVPNHMSGPFKMLAHGTTLHGAQAQDSRWRCRPLVYYAPDTPIGQVFQAKAKAHPALNIGAVGLGAGTVAAYVRPADTLTFFEIDPLVVRISTDPKHFSYTTECAKGTVRYVIGDARLTVTKQPPDGFDILLIDAFSSDSVPTHLLTVEAVREYLTKLKPDGVLILHLSNRNLELRGPAMAVAQAAGGSALIQRHLGATGAPMFWDSDEDAVIVARAPQALTAFSAGAGWRPIDPNVARPWTDDYVNLIGALYARMKEKWDWLP